MAEPGSLLAIDNQTNETLAIFIEKLHEVDIPPGEVLKFRTTLIIPSPDFYPAEKKFPIEAKTKQGEMIYSENFTWQELDDMGWTIVIPPLHSGEGSCDNTTGK